MKELIIDSLVVLCKVAIDRTKARPLIKNLSKVGVELVALILKEQCSIEISDFRRAAERYGVYKVVAIPILEWNVQDSVAFRAYGGDPHGFFRCLGLQIISENADGNMLNMISGLEKSAGFVLYEKT